MMKTMTGIAFALAVLSASPASAQAFQGNWWDAYHSFGHPDDAYNAYAAYPEASSAGTAPRLQRVTTPTAVTSAPIRIRTFAT